MSGHDDLSMLDQTVMLAIMRLRDNAYGITIADAILERTGKECSLGTIYAVLEKLEIKGFLTAREGEATKVRGGRKKKYYSLSGSGNSALTSAMNAMEKMKSGLQIGGVLA